MSIAPFGLDVVPEVKTMAETASLSTLWSMKLLSPFQINETLMKATKKDSTIFMHCLPAVKGQEVTEAVFESTASRVWDQAENRKHTIKAIMLGII